MSLHREVSKHIESIFKESAETFGSYQRKVGLPCLTGCGACCLSRDISASISEMLPSAFRILDEEGIEAVEKLILELESTDCKVCTFYRMNSDDGTEGYCANYETRPSLCRSFAVAAYPDKNGSKTMSICKRLKEAYPERIGGLNALEAPTIGDYAKQVYLTGPSADAKLLHINDALCEALKKVWNLSAYT